MKAIILDTNALIVPVQSGVDIFSELISMDFGECIVPSGVVRELELIAGGSRRGGAGAGTHARSGADRNAARVALSLLTRCRIVETVGDVDDAIIELAIESGCAVLTNDSELRARLRDRGVAVVYLRQRSYLVEGAG
ncbi:MAG: DNA-binding protein [Methanosarcinales archaeon]|nr:DNA-binding protein [Methanosarcinales archaeon]